MSYTPTEWRTGDTVTAEKLNKLENRFPEYDNSNIGDYLCVAEGEPVIDTVVVPEQTITMTSGTTGYVGTVVDADFTDIEDDDTLVVTIGENEYSASVEVVTTTYTISDEEMPATITYDGTDCVISSETLTGNIVLTVVKMETTSIAKWEAVSSDLPTYTSADNGKVLTVNSGGTGVEWAEGGSSLPSITGNANKFLKVKSNASDVQWATVREVPSPSYNIGKYLVVNSSNNPTWDDIPWILFRLQKTNNTWSIDTNEIGSNRGINGICDEIGYNRECSVYAQYTHTVDDSEFTDIMKAFSVTTYQDTTTYIYHLVARFIPLFTGNSMPIITVDAYVDDNSGNNVANVTVKNVTLS